MILVTGGEENKYGAASTEVGSYSQLSQEGPFWRFAGNLPSSRRGLRAVQFGNTIIVTGGESLEEHQPSTTVLMWDPSSETWSKIGKLNFRRSFHASLAVDTSLFSYECLSSIN